MEINLSKKDSKDISYCESYIIKYPKSNLKKTNKLKDTNT